MTKQDFFAISLPYGLCVISECDLDNRDYDEICIYKPYHYTDEFIEKSITSDVQLAILHPLTDLTKEIEHNGKTFVPIVELAKMSWIDEVVDFKYQSLKAETVFIAFSDKYNVFGYDSNTQSFFGAADGESCSVVNQFSLFENMIKWHFDIAGLIDKGEAIDINTLNINHYK